MAKPDPKKVDEIELRPDGEERFLAAVHAAAKSGPKHRPPKPDSVVVQKTGKR